MADPVQLARQLGWVAAHLDGLGYQYVGVVRQSARALLTLPEPSDGGCAGCSTPLVQPATGRRRKWCSEACRRRHRP